jgi:hypothetical protein
VLAQTGGGRVTPGMYSVSARARRSGASRVGVYVVSVSVMEVGSVLERDSRCDGVSGREYVSARSGECWIAE